MGLSLGRSPNRAVAVASIAATLAGVAPSASRAQSVVSATLVDTRHIDVDALDRWLRGWFARHLADAETGAPGAVVAVVQGGRVLLTRGYGLADLETRKPARPDTVFRVGSVSKPVTATAVMQLVEAGRVDVGAPVSSYVRDVPLPVRSGRPVTVRDLICHAGGFDVRLEGTAARSDADVQPLGRYLRDHMPPQVRPAGDVISYSNHGYALLGHLVEHLSGQPFEAYAAARIFHPLGMTRSAFRLTGALARDAATGYERGPGGFRRSVVIHPHIYPAAGLNTTAEDMAWFMVAHLNGGRTDTGEVLSAASTEEMHRQQFTTAPGVPGMAFGFFEFPLRGERALVHSGGIRGFMSGLALWPDRQLGLFVSNNGYSGAIVSDLVTDFARRYLPAGARVPKFRDAAPLERLAGSYRPVTETQGTLEKAGSLRSGDLELGVDYWRRLTIGRSRFEQVGVGAFVGAYDDEPLWVVERGGSRPALAVTLDPVSGVVAWERVPWYATARCHREILFACVAVLLSVFIPRRRTTRTARPSSGRTPARRAAAAARVLLLTVAGMDLLVLVLIWGAFRSASSSGVLLGIPRAAAWALALNLASAGLCVPLALAVWPVSMMREWPVRARVHFCFGVAACLVFAVWSWYWNLLGIGA
jgi:CubicO group peptidase (beta-lactamase class C family)